MKRNKVLVGNWKMHKLAVDAKHFSQDSRELVALAKKHQVLLGVAPTYLSLQVTKENNPELLVLSQNVYFEDKGAFTGEISWPMLEEIHVDGALIGHSERRTYFNETSLACHKKIAKMLSLDRYALYCVGETLSEFQAGLTKEVIRKQISEGLQGLSTNNFHKLIIAYEPVWSIGTGINASAEIAQDICKFIREELANLFSKDLSDRLPILYGGSVKPNNIAEYLSLSDVDGALVGGASLEIHSFKELLQAII